MRTYTVFDVEDNPLSITRLYTLTLRNGTVIRGTTYPLPVIVGSDTFLPLRGLKAFDISERNDGTPASTQLQFSVYVGGPVTLQDVADGLLDGVTLEIDLTDPENPTGKHFDFYGQAGTTDKPIYGVVTLEFRNPYAFPRLELVPSFSVMCRFPFGGVMCGIPVMRPEVARSTAYVVGDTYRKLTGSAPTGYGNVYFEVTSITTGITASSAPTYDYTVGNSTTDGGLTVIARNAWERACAFNTPVNRHNLTLVSSADPRDVDSWYAPGKLQFMSGRNKYRIFKIGGWRQSDLQLTTYLPAGLLTVAGDTALIWPDCDKTMTMCRDKYANARRFGGFPYFEGAKAVALQG